MNACPSSCVQEQNESAHGLFASGTRKQIIFSQVDRYAQGKLPGKLVSSHAEMLNYNQFTRVHPLSGKGSVIKIKNLEKSMRLNGFDISEPIDVVAHNGKFYIVDGHHRYRAAQMAGINEIPVKIISDIKNHHSSWNTIEEIVQDAASCGLDRLKFKY